MRINFRVVLVILLTLANTLAMLIIKDVLGLIQLWRGLFLLLAIGSIAYAVHLFNKDNKYAK